MRTIKLELTETEADAVAQVINAACNGVGNARTLLPIADKLSAANQQSVTEWEESELDRMVTERMEQKNG